MATISEILQTNLVRDNNTLTNGNFEELNTKKVESDISLVPIAQQGSFIKVEGIVFLSKADYDDITSYDSNVIYLVQTVGLYLGTVLIAELNTNI